MEDKLDVSPRLQLKKSIVESISCTVSILSMSVYMLQIQKQLSWVKFLIIHLEHLVLTLLIDFQHKSVNIILQCV